MISIEESIRFTRERIDIVKKNLREIKKRTDVDISIKGLDVILKGKAVDVLKLKNTLNALFEGFVPRESFKLLNEKNQLMVVRLNDYTSSGMSVEKMKGRIIGEGGRTKRLLEELTKVSVSVHGNRVSLIGKPKEIASAKKAIQMLVNGKPHGKVYRYLEQNQQKKEEMI